MAKCPRCGAVNRPGKVACWKCLAPIPPPPPAQPTSHTPPMEPKLAVPFRRMLNIPDLTVTFPKRRAHTEQPDPSTVMEPEAPASNPQVAAAAVPPLETPTAPEVVHPETIAPVPEVDTSEDTTAPPEAAVEEEPQVDEIPVVPEGLIPQSVEEEVAEKPAADEIITEPVLVPVEGAFSSTPFALADEEDAPDAEDALAKPARSFIYVAGAAFPRQDRTWISVMVILTLLIAGIFVLYHYDFRDKPRPKTAQQAAQEYLFYLRDNARLSQQQLATPGSKGLELPSWFTITDAQLVSVTEADGGAHAMARLQLAPANHFDITSALADLASRAYNVEFTLERDSAYWLVDQRTLFRSLRWKMKQADPKLSLPPWDGVSQ